MGRGDPAKQTWTCPREPPASYRVPAAPTSGRLGWRLALPRHHHAYAGAPFRKPSPDPAGAPGYGRSLDAERSPARWTTRVFAAGAPTPLICTLAAAGLKQQYAWPAFPYFARSAHLHLASPVSALPARDSPLPLGAVLSACGPRPQRLCQLASGSWDLTPRCASCSAAVSRGLSFCPPLTDGLL